MSPDELNELEQLDGLAGELAEAGRVARARVAAARPDPAFAARLRAELLASLATGESRPVSTAAPVPPARPAGFIERRNGARPFTDGPRTWAPEERPFGRRAEDREGGPVAAAETYAERWLAPGRAADAAEAGRAPVDPAVLAAARDQSRHIPSESSLRPSVQWHIPTRLFAPRGMVAAMAACAAIVALLFGTGFLWPAKATATADQAVAATLVRGGSTSDLAAGTSLREGDEIRVAAGGRAILTLGSTVVRLDAGAAVRLDSLAPADEVVTQLGGRVYHRVSVPAGGEYSVVTASVTWEAKGTAFDLDRHATAGGGEEVVGLALQHGLDLAGPQLKVSLAEGNSATVTLLPDGSTGGSPAVGAITAAQLGSPWLAANAALDLKLGLPLGLLATVVASPSASSTARATAEPTDEATAPAESPSDGASASASATAKAAPTPLGYLGKLTAVNNGNGTYTLRWPVYSGSGFQYYKVTYCAWSCTPSYPASDMLAAITARDENTWTGALSGGDYAFRVQVVDLSSGDTVIRASSTVLHLVVVDASTPPPTVSLGDLTWVLNGDGSYSFWWNPYTGGRPFSYYKLVFELTSSGRTPDYTNGSPYWAVPGTGDTTVALDPGTGGFQPGDYLVRIQAIGYPNGSAYAYGETTVLHFVLPAPATPSPSVCPAVVGPGVVGGCPSPSPSV
jgi:hypothetical protein